MCYLPFQMTKILLVFSIFHEPYYQSGSLKLRFTLMMPESSFEFWCAFILRLLNTMIWNLAFAFGNKIHLVYLIIWFDLVWFDLVNK